MTVTREQVISYRVAAQQFDRSVRSARSLAVLDIGVQDGVGEQARLAFAARLPSPPAADVFGPDKALALVWSLRGAPYVHRRADLDELAGALYPLSETDAAQRLNETGPAVARVGIAAREQYDLAVGAMRRAVSKPIAKGAASTAVTKTIPDGMRRQCRACRTSHVSDSAMRSSFLAAGLELQPDTSPPVLLRRTGTRAVHTPDAAALTRLIRAYLTLLGPASCAHVAGYLGARRSDIDKLWPDDLVEVKLGKTTLWLPAECERAFESVSEPDLVRLLGGCDPYLQARDRELIVADKSVHKAMWPVLGRPGAVFADGEVVGLWRARSSGSKVSIAVEEFAPLPKPVWSAVESEAERVAAVRGLPLGAVTRT